MNLVKEWEPLVMSVCLRKIIIIMSTTVETKDNHRMRDVNNIKVTLETSKKTRVGIKRAMNNKTDDTSSATERVLTVIIILRYNKSHMVTKTNDLHVMTFLLRAREKSFRKYR